MNRLTKIKFLEHVPKKLFEKRNRRIRKKLRSLTDWCYLVLKTCPFNQRKSVVKLLNIVNLYRLELSENISIIENHELGGDKVKAYLKTEDFIFKIFYKHLVDVCLTTNSRAPFGIHGKLLRCKEYRKRFIFL